MTTTSATGTATGKVGITKVFSRVTRDPFLDNVAKARNLGTVESDKTRLTVFTALAARDNVDYFSFNLKTDVKNLTIGFQNNGGARIQLLDKAGRSVIADSSRNGTAIQQKAFEDALSGNLELKKGQYILKISRDGVPSNVKPTYVASIYAGKFKTDYDTRELPPSWQDVLSGSSTTTLFDVLSTKSSKENPLGLNIFNYFA